MKKLALLTVLLVGGTLATQAGVRFGFRVSLPLPSVTIGPPVVYQTPPPVVYSAPAPYYYAAPPVVYAPPVAYCAPVPGVYFGYHGYWGPRHGWGYRGWGYRHGWRR
jgi:hypothetical protein